MYDTVRATIFFICFSSLLTESLVSCESEEGESINNGVIIDCGKSMTSVGIFAWNSTLEYPKLMNNIRFLKQHDNGEDAIVKVPQNLLNLIDNSNRLRKYVKLITNFIDANVFGENRDSLIIFVIGTADIDQYTQQTLLESIKLEIERNQSKSIKVEVSLETKFNKGIYRWIAINSLNKRFIESVKGGIEKKLTFAVVEMTKQDVQVTFHYKMGMDGLIAGYLQKSPRVALSTLLNFKFEPKISWKGRGGYPCTLISVLFKGLGIETARIHYIDYLVKLNIKTVQNYMKKSEEYRGRKQLFIQDPCLPSKVVEVIDRPKRILSAIDKVAGLAKVEDEDEDEEKLTLSMKGTGNYWKCQTYIKNLFEFAKEERLNCDITDSYCATSLIGTLFLPFEFYDVVGVFDFDSPINLGNQYDGAKITGKMKEFCTRPYKELLEVYAKPYTDLDYVIIQLCFKALYIDTFLTYAIQMPKDYDKFKTIDESGNQNLDWILGAMVDKATGILTSRTS